MTSNQLEEDAQRMHKAGKQPSQLLHDSVLSFGFRTLYSCSDDKKKSPQAEQQPIQHNGDVIQNKKLDRNIILFWE